MTNFWRNNRGDTIVEVLISLAVLTLVLGGAYYTANRSYRNDRDSQEHTEALSVAQTQIEDIRVLGNVRIGNSFLPGSRSSSCIDSSLNLSTSCSVESNDTTKFKPSCPATSPYCYDVLITELSPTTLTEGSPNFPVNLETYEVQVTWSALGGGTDNVTLYYRWDS